ncbi:MAG: hypothetical protein JSW11_12025 [Candidatus Heimdallarchaeota archaeon]|nr:MAG: hypothetical protein JSW11_12025 [Candidatus Heimdallarchaeota archaeon]
MCEETGCESRKGIGYYTKILQLIIVTIVLMAVPFVQAFSSPSMTPLIVNMESTSPEVAVTISELKNELSAISVHYNSLQYVIESLRTSSIIIFVGHGGSQGIQADERIVDYTQLIENNPAPVIIFAACKSNEAAKLSTTKTVFGFQGKIDGILAANCINYILGSKAPQFTKRENVLERVSDNIVSRLIALENGQPEMTLPLVEEGGGSSSSSTSSQPYMSDVEWRQFGIQLIITLLTQAALIWGIPYIITTYGSTFVSKLGAFFRWLFRRGTPEVSLLARIASLTVRGVTLASIANLTSLFLRILYSGASRVVDAIYNTANPLDWIICGISIATAIYALFQSSGVSFIVGVGIAAWPLYKVVINGIRNYQDTDGSWTPYYRAWFEVLMLF